MPALAEILDILGPASSAVAAAEEADAELAQ